jgi:hypothetical protein
VSSDDLRHGRRVVDGLLATFLVSPRFRSAILNQATYLQMQRVKDLMNFENRLNLVRMELKQLHKPPNKSTLIVAFIQGLREELILLPNSFLRVLSTLSPLMILFNMSVTPYSS